MQFKWTLQKLLACFTAARTWVVHRWIAAHKLHGGGCYSVCRMLWLWSFLLPQFTKRRLIEKKTAPVDMRLLTRWTSLIVFKLEIQQALLGLPFHMSCYTLHNYIYFPPAADSSSSSNVAVLRRLIFATLVVRHRTGEKLLVKDKRVGLSLIYRARDWLATGTFVCIT